MTEELELKGIDAASEFRARARRIAKFFYAHRYMTETLGLGADERTQQLGKDADLIADYLGFIEETFTDPVQLVRFIKGEHQTFRGSF